MYGREGGHPERPQRCDDRGSARKSPGQLRNGMYGSALLVAILKSRPAGQAIECKSCTAIGKNLKPVIPAKQFKALTPCIVPSQEIHIDFAGPINNEKEHEIYILTCIYRFSKYPSVEIFENAKASNVIRFLDNYIHTHGVPRSLRIDQVRCLIGNQVKNFCTKTILL